ncbi:MAG TPA: hypothetical protein VLA88_05585 [Candidatus Saccharimonadales bacterium]|nr:hypothetical protein [Candidatus Saccharimonadales bacterium]
MNYINHPRGAFFALLGPVVGVAAWVLLWQVNVVAAISAFLLAWLTVKMYKLGAGGLDAKALHVILPYIAIGALVAFLGGMAADGLRVYAENNPGADQNWFALLGTTDFWNFMWLSAADSAFWQGYGTDIIISIAFIALGTYVGVREAVMQTRPTAYVQPRY